MKNLACLLVLFVVLLVAFSDAQTCEPSGGTYGIEPPPGKCNSTTRCCIPGQFYPTYSCSPPRTEGIRSTLTLRSFGKGSGSTKCDQRHHSNQQLVVGMSTGYLYELGAHRCNHYIKIKGNGRSVKVKVVDECDSMAGCDELHDYKPPCHNHVISASKAVWKALRIPENKWEDELAITWSDA